MVLVFNKLVKGKIKKKVSVVYGDPYTLKITRGLHVPISYPYSGTLVCGLEYCFLFRVARVQRQD